MKRPRVYMYIVLANLDLSRCIAKRASDVITQTNSAKQTAMVKDLTLFQAPKQVLLKTTF